LSVEAWEKAVKTGRLWTPDPQLNRGLQAGRLECMRGVQRMRTGLAPSSRRVCEIPALVKCMDLYDVTESRNLLAHARRMAEKSGGRMPVLFPVLPKDEPADPGRDLAHSNAAYLRALAGHLQRHPDMDLLNKHYAAAAACAEALVQSRWQAGDALDEALDEAGLAAASAGLEAAAELAAMQGDGVNAARWESEATLLRRMSGARPAPFAPERWLDRSGWQFHTGRPWGFADPMRGIELAGEMAWAIGGLHRHEGELRVEPSDFLEWWALLDLPFGERSVSIVWDGETLHASAPVQSSKPVALYDRIRAAGAGEFDFDLRFEMQRGEGSGAAPKTVHLFRPRFTADPET